MLAAEPDSPSSRRYGARLAAALAPVGSSSGGPVGQYSPAAGRGPVAAATMSQSDRGRHDGSAATGQRRLRPPVPNGSQPSAHLRGALTNLVRPVRDRFASLLVDEVVKQDRNGLARGL